MEQVRSGSQEPRTREGTELGAVTCGLSDAEFAQQAERVIADFSQGMDQVEELPDGYALRFPGSGEWIAKLLDFIVYERGCCPFFAFELVFEAEAGPVWLRFRGAGVKEFLERAHLLASG